MSGLINKNMPLVSAVRNREEISHILLNLIKRVNVLDGLQPALSDAITDGVINMAPTQNAVYDALTLKANLDSPIFTGTPSLPIDTVGVTQNNTDDSTKIATTAFVKNVLSNVSIGDVSATQPGKVNNTALQELGGADKLINGVRIGIGNESDNTNTVVGFEALSANTSFANTALGYQTLKNTTIGGQNVAIGWSALVNNVEGWANIGIGTAALIDNTIGSYNVAIGLESMQSNTSGNYNTAVGEASLERNTTGNSNAAFGQGTLGRNTTGSYNTAIGDRALNDFNTGQFNTAVGADALSGAFNATGNYNSVVGYTACINISTGSRNSTLGYDALKSNTTGNDNIAIGGNAGSLILSGGFNGVCNNSIFIGNETRPSGNNETNQIVIGHSAIGAGSNTITIGNNSIVSTILKGLITAPLTTNTLIAGGSPKSLITREYFEANAFNIPHLEYNLTDKTVWNNGKNNVATNTSFGELSMTNTTAGSNTGIGYSTLLNNISGIGNTSVGYFALANNTTGNSNTGIGINALINNTTGINNTAIGGGAGQFITDGTTPLTVSTQSIFLGGGTRALANNSNNEIVIGVGVTGLGTNTTTIGNTSTTITRLRGAVQGGSFVKDGGTSSQFLMADGSVSIVDGSETKVQAGTNTTVTGTGTAENPYIINSTVSGGGTAARYTPVVTLGVNTTAPLVTSHTYTIIGSAVTVAGTVNVSILTSGDASTFYISLPVNRATSGNFIVGFGNLGISQEHVTVYTSDTATAMISFTSNSSNVNATYSFTYLTTD